MFEDGWSWGGKHQGGKLGFGLGGGSTPAGGEVKPDGFTCRLMWRGNHDGTGRLCVYSYAADRGKTYRRDLNFDPGTVTIGKWHDVEV